MFPSSPIYPARFLSFWCCSKYCSCAPSCPSLASFFHFSLNVEDISSAWIRSVSRNSATRRCCRERFLENEVLRWIRFKMCYVHCRGVSQVWLSAECRFCARRDTRIRSPLELSYFVKNRKPKIDSRRRYKLYEIYWVARDHSRRDNRHERRWKAIALIGSFLHFQKRICWG